MWLAMGARMLPVRMKCKAAITPNTEVYVAWIAVPTVENVRVYGIIIRKKIRNVMLCNAMWCNAMQYDVMQCDAMQCDVMQSNGMWCNAMQWNVM